MRQPINTALSVVEGMLENQSAGRSSPSFENVVEVVHGFQRIEFEVPDSVDADGFLFQYGVVNWLAEPVFSISFVRQLEIVDSEDEHEGYSHVQLEFRYRVDSDLRESLSHSSWWFDDGNSSFDEWLEVAKNDPVWRVVTNKSLIGFDVSQELA